jgi:hypothetical protein
MCLYIILSKGDIVYKQMDSLSNIHILHKNSPNDKEIDDIPLLTSASWCSCCFRYFRPTYNYHYSYHIMSQEQDHDLLCYNGIPRVFKQHPKHEEESKYSSMEPSKESHEDLEEPTVSFVRPNLKPLITDIRRYNILDCPSNEDPEEIKDSSFYPPIQFIEPEYIGNTFTPNPENSQHYEIKHIYHDKLLPPIRTLVKPIIT